MVAVAEVTVEEVRELVRTTRKDSEIRNSYIRIARNFREANLGVGAGGEGDEGERSEAYAKTLHDIDLLLAAHFTVIVEEKGALIREEIEGAEDAWADVYDPGLRSTRFGQQAIMLDTTGRLNDVGQVGRLKAEFRVV